MPRTPPPATPEQAPPTRDLTRFAYLSIAAAIVTITLKGLAWQLTGSVGLLSDAAESVVNLVAAIAVLIALRVAAMPPDKNHHFGHTKAEYFSAALEGQMIFIAAVVIMWSAVERFLHPQPIDNVGIGLGVSVVASVVNGVVALVLLRAGRQHRSLTLVADGKHLMTDVWTSAGVIVGVLLVALTGVERLDPIVAFLVGLNIIFTGWKLLQQSVEGLMDIAMSKEDNKTIAEVISDYVTKEVHFHGLRTRVSGHHRFAEVHVLVPGAWSVQRGHDLMEDVEAAVHRAVEDVTLTCHLEPSEDPRAYGDYAAEFPIPTHPDIVAAQESARDASGDQAGGEQAGGEQAGEELAGGDAPHGGTARSRFSPRGGP
ncbi:MAG: cation diffusion facilitator family transporter [Intrasporangium sp.]|uniref:cation diffusion facilitator family transporter n=1 Tax=Intrasporangium sp. TaxID=1925024 RepID=UPI002647CDF2|nr:cation diffusion facilitator family transporter [Intrasporangium sp.]MDN5797363.1 cation diffusion facilitator family transporter [Intrasporangium sp.]